MVDFNKTDDLIRRARSGDRDSLDELFSLHRGRLRRMISLRLAPRLRARIGESDVVQEVYMEASCRLPSFLEESTVPFFVWLRGIAGQKLVDLYRHHFGAQMRDVRREVSLGHGGMPQATSAVLAVHLLGTIKSPSAEVAEAEMKIKVQEGLEGMEPMDRDVLVLRHFEHLSNVETAHELGIKEAAASQRYVRALERLKGILSGMRSSFESG